MKIHEIHEFGAGKIKIYPLIFGTYKFSDHALIKFQTFWRPTFTQLLPQYF